MTETRSYLANATLQFQKNDDAVSPPPSLPGDQASHTGKPIAEGKYVAVSPSGTRVPIPKELFLALQDFMKTRKSPGSITIQFRGGEIVCVEAVAKKTYRNS